MTLQIQNEATLRNAFNEGINLFLGAGFSVLAYDTHGQALPTGAGLADELRVMFADDFPPETLADLSLPQLCTVLEASRADSFRAALQTRFSISTFDDRYRALELLNIETIFTTNIDDLVEQILENSIAAYVNDIDLVGPAFADRRAVDLFHLHGAVTNRGRPFRFGAPDIAGSFNADPDRWRYLQLRLDQRPNLVWGYSLEDPAALEAVAETIRPTGRRSPSWIAVRPSDVSPARTAYLAALGFHVIEADTNDLLEYVSEFRPTRPGVGPQRNAALILADELVPPLGAAPVRPIAEFFAGQAPVWQDIHSGLIPRTSYYAAAEDVVLSDRSLIITGIPASGKSTLLMQLAVGLQTARLKVYLRQPTLEKTRWVIRTLAESPAIVFLDEFSDEADSFTLLAEQPNITLVGAERDYQVSRVLNRIPIDAFQMMDVTEPSQTDLQKCRDAIPARMRAPKMRQPKMTPGRSPSIFEFIQENSTAPHLRDRFREAIVALRTDNPRVLQTLILTAYLHSCRVPLSFDVALGYWSSDDVDYSGVYELLDATGALISEAERPKDMDEDQDYFLTRSALVSDAILRSAKRSDLRLVLRRFHSHVAAARIPRYPTFRRTAFDHSLFEVAFPDVDEGAEFYDELFDKYDIPYILQHKALYLTSSGKRQFTQAFRDIDRALGIVGPSNWTIRNTHAEILFRANVGFAENGDISVRPQLDDSLSTLTLCFERDVRKAVHATVFADNAVRYWRCFHDDAARAVLERAHSQLLVARQREPWLDGVRRLTRTVEGALREANDL